MEKSFLLMDNAFQLKNIMPISNLILLFFEDLITKTVLPIYDKLNSSEQTHIFSKVN